MPAIPGCPELPRTTKPMEKRSRCGVDFSPAPVWSQRGPVARSIPLSSLPMTESERAPNAAALPIRAIFSRIAAADPPPQTGQICERTFSRLRPIISGRHVDESVQSFGLYRPFGILRGTREPAPWNPGYTHSPAHRRADRSGCGVRRDDDHGGAHRWGGIARRTFFSSAAAHCRIGAVHCRDPRSPEWAGCRTIGAGPAADAPGTARKIAGGAGSGRSRGACGALLPGYGLHRTPPACLRHRAVARRCRIARTVYYPKE